MKKTYIIPELNITTLAVENMIAVSGPQTIDTTSADSQYGMDVKQQRNDYNVWDDDWSR